MKKHNTMVGSAKFLMALLVAARHVIQIYYPAESRWRLVIGNWLSNLAVPVFFVIAGFLLFKKLTNTDLDHYTPLCMPHPEIIYTLVHHLLAY